MTDYGYSVEVPAGYDEAVIRTRLALRAEGFSILTEMHVGGMLGPEAGTDRQYLIMAVWNAQIASREIGTDLKVGVHLPCSVVVHDNGPDTIVAALDPGDAVEGQVADGDEAIEAARAALGRALQTIATETET